MSYPNITGETVSFQGHNGDKGEAYYARPGKPGRVGGVVLIHHAPGWDEWIIETTRKIAHHGFACISPHLYFRDGPGSPDDVGARVRAAGGVPDNQVVGDVSGAIAFLKSQANSNGKIGLIGFCSGGRHVYLARAARRRDQRRGRLLGRQRDRRRSQAAQRQASGRADRAHRQDDGAAARPVRQRRREPEPRPGQPHRGEAQGSGQELRIPPLRRRRPRVLQLRARPRLSRRSHRGRLEEGVRILDKHLGGAA